ncbi:MAG: L-2-amino-thiazoline-4-carboxylic acid hydrolase [Humidesulfovibrio sp.]|uniref:L-2-amino-thiazoline-4-carboxylic acid hydrolase n=1 Tax=Humidesulfovibrio sp. TaxID=2910988 RepID=UPI0027F684EB|nr:L-2-amino-thiazoline-4-carboxylic acid hydrolase [Humidesulfovibrio sp.]MDQ7834413.1 L-2-amino-thiazoline-4-carboxylic acid hydrolase [Humidesulfovibrio sp.]
MCPLSKSIPLLERRAIEAEMLLRVYDASCAAVGSAVALGILEQAVDSAALAAGRLFARSAPVGGPSLAHFATVLERWQEGGVIDITDIKHAEDTLSFTVKRCGYVQRYADLGVPASLHTVFSCRRDAAFAEGYSANLRMERPETIAQGHTCCRFTFRWEP